MSDLGRAEEPILVILQVTKLQATDVPMTMIREQTVVASASTDLFYVSRQLLNVSHSLFVSFFYSLHYNLTKVVHSEGGSWAVALGIVSHFSVGWSHGECACPGCCSVQNPFHCYYLPCLVDGEQSVSAIPSNRTNVYESNIHILLLLELKFKLEENAHGLASGK